MLLEDDTRDAGLIQDVLEAENFACDVIRTQTRAEFLAALDDDAIDLILADYTLPSFDGLSALMLASSARSDLPFIIVSGTLGEEVAIEALKIGATDYVLKTGMSRLVPSVQRALREARVRAERKLVAKAARRQHEAVEVKTPLRVLLLEDDPQDAKLIQDLLETDHFVCEITCVQTRAEFLAALKSGRLDLILADYQLPSFDGISALELARSERQDLPFIFVSGMIGEEAAIDALRIGATDYILKPRLGRLVPAVQRALREARERAERRVVAEAARRSEKELLDVIEAIPTMAFSALADGSSVWVNRRWVEYSGLSVEDTSGAGWQATLHPDDLNGHMIKWQQTLASGEPFENEARHRSASGEYRWFLIRAVTLRDEQGKIRKWYGTLTDIEDRKRTEERLRVQHTVGQILAEAATIEEVTPRVLRAIGEGLGWDVGALWCVDREVEALRCIELWHNASIEVPEFERVSRKFTFVPGLGLPGRVWSSLEPEYIPDVVRDDNFPRGPIAQREGLHAAFGLPILLGGEVLGVIEFFSREIRQPDQELLNMLATIGSQIGQFIERKRAEEAFRKVQMQLAHANRVATMGQLSASIANEVKQPITAAVTYALAARRWLSAEPPNFREVDDALSHIVKEGNRAGEVLGRTPALIKKVPARKDAVAINDAILEVIALTRTEAANNGVSVRTQLAEGLPRIQGDRVQLQQVLLNLTINAIEAMRDFSEEERELLISSRNEPDGVSVEVRDSGPGFAPADLDRVFEAFYSTKPGGLGLGLSICRSIIEAHNGRLWASPNVPRGAIFSFLAPAYPAAAS